MQTLSKQINGVNVTLTHIEGNTFKLTADGGVFSKGKDAIYSDGSSIKTAIVNGNELIIRKAEIKRLGTYMIYLNGERLSLSGSWVNNNGVKIVMADPERDIYYYFNRPDCGIHQVYTVNSDKTDNDIAYTSLHRLLGEEGVIAK